MRPRRGSWRACVCAWSRSGTMRWRSLAPSPCSARGPNCDTPGCSPGSMPTAPHRRSTRSSRPTSPPRGSRYGSRTRWSPRRSMRTSPRHSGRAGTSKPLESCRTSTSSLRVSPRTCWRRRRREMRGRDHVHDAARSASAEGATELAARYLERSLQEPPADASRLELLGELGRLEVSLGRSEGVGRLRAALDLATEGDEGRADARAGTRPDGRR